MRRRGVLRSMAVLAALGLASAACGSTVSSAERRRAEQAARGSEELEAQAGSPDAVADASTDASAVPADRASGATATTRRSAGGTGTGGPAASTAVGPGVTADKIFLGAAYAVNSSAANAAIGATGLTAGDPKRTYEIVIADVNANGGVAGRKLEPVFHETDGATTASYDVVFQRVCDTWTQDNKVFAAFAGGNETMLQCLHNRGVIGLFDDLTSADAATFRRYPYYVEIGTINLDRIAGAEVAGLNAQGYFNGWNHATGQAAPGKAKVGVLAYDAPGFNHAVSDVLIPELRKVGVAPAPEDVVRIKPLEQTADTGPVAAAVSSAVLKFRSDRVTHVIIFDERGLLTLLFTQNADSQGYRPRYGMNTQNGPQALIDGAGLPPRQLAGALGIGWLPSLDMPPAQNPRTGPYSNDARRRCYNLLTSKGQSFSDANAESIAMGICTSVWFFRDAVKASGNVLNRAAFMNGVAKLGSSFQSTGTFASRFSATQHDGVAAVRRFAFDLGCTCVRYTSGNVFVP